MIGIDRRYGSVYQVVEREQQCGLAAFLENPLMKRLYSIVVVLFFASAYTQTAKPKLAQLYADKERNPTYVKVDGVWEPDNPTKQNALAFAVVSIQCYKHGGIALVGSESFCVVATASPIGGTISVDADFVKVIEWNAQEIITLDDSPICLKSQNTLDLTSKTVAGLDIRKPNAKGFLDSCKMLPDRQTYYLRDKVDYSLNHVSTKK
jgi:hypothetical protein